ncbi:MULTISPECIES: DUF6417 family protein [Streptomyces]|uniref:DUF6417 family protein n=1 Tax=Streptomyces TaxID=1883 RepID=UPI001C2F5E4B
MVELVPSQMAALRVFVGRTGRLGSGCRSLTGLAEQVRAASCDHGIKRWRLYLTQEQMASVAYGLWLHRMAGSAAEANRCGHEYGAVHRPAPTVYDSTARRSPSPTRTAPEICSIRR